MRQRRRGLDRGKQNSGRARAAICHDTYSAHQGVEHDDMNVLVLGERVVGKALAQELVTALLAAKFSGEARACATCEQGQGDSGQIHALKG